MPSRTDYQNTFITLFNQTARGHSRYQVFRDFCYCAMAAIHNRYCYSDELEQFYLKTIKKYDRDDIDRIVQLFSLVVLGLAREPCDFLGRVFMLLELGDKHLQQFFTPWEVTRMMAKIQFQDVSALLQEKPFVTLHEPACGSGCMTLAVAAVMAYIQLSLTGIPAQVTIGDALCDDDRKRTRYTPAHYLGNWSQRLQACQPQTAA
ncbi:SAM-dependent DNA methyltransferase [Xenorhabdus sp. IM139775]|uniref:SAM-dependent DNA methyltransferase n=1 Tax=Xenorhabdus sp. IM139775 TaxID=3025876 RepID=UPI0023597B21|nr:SAM-dependent DNA methyltransferase [Xenorhabdus sp. IM139775]MDC9595161.1 SAM-dependent DNA methyltransferase [Xenorhabdus sp. IM139775]